MGWVETLRQMEKMMVTSIFSSSNNPFKSFVFLGRGKLGLFGKELMLMLKAAFE